MLLLIPVLAFAWLLGELSSTAVIQHFFFVAMIVSLIWGGIGTSAARVLLMPLVLLLLAVPMGESLIPPLQDFSAWFAVKLLDLSRVPALLEGRFITIPSSKWEVAEACSGIRFLLASFTLGFVYAALTYRKWGRRMTFLAASVVIPVLANGLRIYGIILTDYLGGKRLARSATHVFAGWVFFFIITLLLFALGRRWREGTPKEPLGDLSSDGEISTPASGENGRTASVRGLVLFAVAVVVVASVAPITAKLLSQKQAIRNPFALQATLVAPPWSPTGRDLFGWQPVMQFPDAEVVQTYESRDHVVKLYVAYYGPGGKDAKLVSTANSLFGRTRWQRTGERSVESTIEGRPIRVYQTSIRSPQASLVLWSWYWVDGKFTGSGYGAKWLLAKSRVTRSPLGSAVIVAATEEQLGDPSAAGVLEDFASHLSLSEGLRSPTSNAGGGVPSR
jgi:exosortase A